MNNSTRFVSVDKFANGELMRAFSELSAYSQFSVWVMEYALEAWRIAASEGSVNLYHIATSRSGASVASERRS